MFLKNISKIAPHSLHQVKNQFRTWIERKIIVKLNEGKIIRNKIGSMDDLNERKKIVRKCFLDGIGGLPDSDAPLCPNITGTLDFAEYKVEKIIFSPRKETYATSNLYIPKNIKKPSAAVLFVLGHSFSAKAAVIYQNAIQCLVKAGLIVFAVDPIGQGERFSYFEPHTGVAVIEPSVTEHIYAGDQADPTGCTSVRYFLHDNMRALDYLLSRSEVDPARVGVTGCSGGGTQTSMLMLADDRIAAAAPAAFIMDILSAFDAGNAQDNEQIWSGLLQCGFDHADIILSACPKPVLILAAEEDFFPIEGTIATFNDAKSVYEKLSCSKNLEIFVDVGKHTYSLNMARRAAAFFAKHLLKTSVNLDEFNPAACDPKILECCSSGQVKGDYPSSKSIHDYNIFEAARLRKLRDALPPPKKEALAKKVLEDIVYFEREKYYPYYPRVISEERAGTLIYKAVMYSSQPNMFGYGVMLKSFIVPKTKGTLICVWQGGTAKLFEHSTFIFEKLGEGYGLFVMDVSGDGNLESAQVGAYKDGLYDDFYNQSNQLKWYGDSIVGVRSYDVMRAAELIKEYFGDEVAGFFGCGKYSVYTAIAHKLFNPALEALVEDGFCGYEHWINQKYYDAYNNPALSVRGILKGWDIV